MPVKNPQLTPIQADVGPPAIQDWEQVIQGGAMIGQTVLENRKTNILEGFRDEVTGIVEEAEKEERVLSAEDETFRSEFATRMNRIHRIATQGVNQGARTRALLEAETALRRAQRERPGLAAELRQEAALVLGTDPTGTQLEVMEKLAQQQSEAAQKEWADHVKHGYEELGIPRTVAPGTQEWYSNYAQLEERYASNVRVVNDLALIKNLEDITDAHRAQADYWLANPTGVFRATVNPLNEAMQVFSQLSPDARLAWMGGQGTLSIGGVDLTGPQFKAMMESATTELDSSFGGLSAEVREALRVPLDSLKSRVTQTLSYLNDPKIDPAVFASQLELETSRDFLLGMTQDERYTLFMTKQLAPYITALNGSDFAKLNLVKKNEMIDLLNTLGAFKFVLPSQRAAQFGRMIQEGAGPVGDPYGLSVQLEYQDYLENVRSLNKVLSEASTEMPEDVASGYVGQWVGATRWIKELPNPAPELVEQWLETFQDPATLEVLQKADPMVAEEYARELVDFFNSNASPITDVYDEVRTFGTRARFRGDYQVPASDVLVPEIRENGQVVLSFAPGNALTDQQKLDYSTKMRTWADALTRRVRAQATLDQLITNETEPDYQRAYLKMAPDFPFTKFKVPGN